MELQFQYTKKEWVDARRKYLFLSKTITRWQIVFLAGFSILILLLLIAHKTDTIIIMSAVVIVFAIIMLVILYFVQPIVLFKNTEKYSSMYSFSFQEEEILFEARGISSVIKWDIFQSYVETDQYFYLLQGKMLYTMLPKRVFPSDEAQQQFRDLLILHYGK